MKKIFIYYSFTNNGNEVAEYLRKKDYDIRKVISDEPLPKNKFLSILTGGFKAGIGYKDRIVDFDNNIDEYDEIVIGSPIWNSRLSSPINTVLDKIDLTNKKVSFILYSGSGKENKATELIKKKYKDAKVINLKEPKTNKDELIKLDN